MDDSGRSFELEWTVIRLKVDGPDELKDKSCPKMSKRSKTAEVDGPIISTSENRRSSRKKLDGRKLLKWTQNFKGLIKAV